MKKRYCETKMQLLIPCDSGWGDYGDNSCSTCQDEPIEKNCRNIIDTRYMKCPYCGSNIGVKEEHLFGDNIRDAIKAIKG